ncbi:1-aminocyclopropane-1-carboxylate oxidase homolog 1-like [Diospyros lotus]|uniref:1-aminocyclopropane-1-carboxylate oxidase homolog 1-like n=1 Tax=Diospyros lotus TaxID=55363 RepID=UPI0022558EA5|nr:1-aminocyclopropane-1-carboxylate oxidase homolog 1-like [Diospyros lotus]
MVASVVGDFDWAKEVKEFEDSKAGVKGLVDSGLKKVPRLFIHSPESLESSQAGSKTSHGPPLDLPTIDFQGVESGGARRREVVEAIREAASTWGFFRMVNHGIPIDTLDAMLEATRRFHEQPTEAKREIYSTDGTRSVRFSGNVPKNEFDPACWMDILSCVFRDDAIDPQIIPSVCRKEVQEYVKYMIKLRETMAELLSEALGLSSDHLSRIECMKSESLAMLYYPVCPEPNLTVGNVRHSDTTFLTVLLQDGIGGLQILHDNQWVDVPPVHGALIANIGDLMQMISNDKFKSVLHKVKAQPVGSRVSVACFFTASTAASAKPFGPIKELLSEDSRPVYREFLAGEYYAAYKSVYGRAASALAHFKL